LFIRLAAIEILNPGSELEIEHLSHENGLRTVCQLRRTSKVNKDYLELMNGRLAVEFAKNGISHLDDKSGLKFFHDFLSRPEERSLLDSFILLECDYLGS
jgi:hypothetical protein